MSTTLKCCHSDGNKTVPQGRGVKFFKDISAFYEGIREFNQLEFIPSTTRTYLLATMRVVLTLAVLFLACASAQFFRNPFNLFGGGRRPNRPAPSRPAPAPFQGGRPAPAPSGGNRR